MAWRQRSHSAASLEAGEQRAGPLGGHLLLARLAEWRDRLREHRADAAAISILVLLAFSLRLIPVVFVPSLNWADEVFQTTEQAHRLVYGTGLVPWEFQLHIRSWLLPGAIAGVMEFARIFGDGPRYYLPIIAGCFGVLALVPVICCFLWCRRWFGLAAGFVGGLCVAVAPELVYMGDRTLSEAVAGHLLVLALYLLAPGYRVSSATRLFWAGIVLGLVFVLRIQLAPAIALIALWTTYRFLRRDFVLAAAGGCTVLAGAAILDAITLGSPLASMWKYAAYNVLYGVSATFGTEPWYYYTFAELATWGTAFSVVLILAMLGTRRTWLPLVAAAIIVASHSLIAHKEYRFIYPAIVLLAVQAGIGLAASVDAAASLSWSRGTSGNFARRAVPVVAGIVWCVLSLATWTGPAMAKLRLRAHAYLLAAYYVRTYPELCGVGVYGKDDWSWFGGYTYLHRPVPIYWPKDRRELATTEKAFDVLMYPTGFGLTAPPLDHGFVKRKCFGEACVAVRAGTCDQIPLMRLPFPAPLRQLSKDG